MSSSRLPNRFRATSPQHGAGLRLTSTVQLVSRFFNSIDRYFGMPSA